MDIFKIDELFDTDMPYEHKDDLIQILNEFKRGHYPNVLSKTSALKDKNDLDSQIIRNLNVIGAICHAEMTEYKAASNIISELYQDAKNDLMMLGELAYMCDYKLSRRIMSAAVKQMEENNETDRIKLARGYLILAESEEKMDKVVRSIKYYQQGLDYFKEGDDRDDYMILYIHFKIGMLHAVLNNTEESITYLDQAILLAGDANPELKINSLVSIAKTHGANDENEKAYPYLAEALEMLENSSLWGTLTHAEALTEMAFYYFDQSKLNEAVPYYEKAIATYKGLQHTSHRKVGMIYMQYAYCLEHMDGKNTRLAGENYEHAIERLEMTKDKQLLENAFADVIAFFDTTNNTKKKELYEDRFVKMVNE